MQGTIELITIEQKLQHNHYPTPSPPIMDPGYIKSISICSQTVKIFIICPPNYTLKALHVSVETGMRMRAVNGGRVFDSSGFIDFNMV